mmetsp:Transcript_1291/g.1747  ORF Transcript_1291/g.1747 Transcript_1291/m.1747 type:complete len:271 (-) Transcript_1291:2323-3135(-)
MNLLKFVGSSQSIVEWLVFIFCIHQFTSAIGYMTPFFRNYSTILSTISSIVALCFTSFETWEEIVEQSEDDSTNTDEHNVVAIPTKETLTTAPIWNINIKMKEVVTIVKFVLLIASLQNSIKNGSSTHPAFSDNVLLAWYFLAWSCGCFIALTESRVDDIWMRALLMGCTFHAQIFFRHDPDALFSFLVPLNHDLISKSKRERTEFVCQIIFLFVISFALSYFFSLLALLLVQLFIGYLSAEYSALVSSVLRSWLTEWMNLLSVGRIDKK